MIDDAEARVRGRYERVTDLDGIRIDFDDGWFPLRASGTQPLVRVTAEADTEHRADELLSEATGLKRSVMQKQTQD